jgi:hypothetical protein
MALGCFQLRNSGQCEGLAMSLEIAGLTWLRALYRFLMKSCRSKFSHCENLTSSSSREYFSSK